MNWSGTKNEYAALLASDTNYTNKWTDLFNQLTDTYKQSVAQEEAAYNQSVAETDKELQTTRDYDISSAYSNYLQQQRALKQSNALFKTPYQNYYEQNYNTNVSSIRSAYESNLANKTAALYKDYASIYDTLTKDYTNEYTTLTKEYTNELSSNAKYLQSVEKSFEEKMKNKYGNDLSASESGAGIFSIDASTGETKLTEKGLAEYKDFLYSSGSTYLNDLKESNEELHDWLISGDNKNMINRYLLGVDDNWSYDEEKSKSGYESAMKEYEDIEAKKNNPYLEVNEETNEYESVSGKITLDQTKWSGYNTSGTFNISDPNTYGTIKQYDVKAGVTKGIAGKYINAIREDAEAGKIKTGDEVVFNYGEGQNPLIGVYLGDGEFAILSKKSNKTDYEYVKSNYKNMYVPDGYFISAGHYHVYQR